MLTEINPMLIIQIAAGIMLAVFALILIEGVSRVR